MKKKWAMLAQGLIAAFLAPPISDMLPAPIKPWVGIAGVIVATATAKKTSESNPDGSRAELPYNPPPKVN